MNTPKKREQGFYWVQYKQAQSGKWTICWWSGNDHLGWVFRGQMHDTFIDAQFEAIDERRLMPPDGSEGRG